MRLTNIPFLSKKSIPLDLSIKIDKSSDKLQ